MCSGADINTVSMSDIAQRLSLAVYTGRSLDALKPFVQKAGKVEDYQSPSTWKTDVPTRS
jgi:hypothetical protein